MTGATRRPLPSRRRGRARGSPSSSSTATAAERTPRGRTPAALARPRLSRPHVLPIRPIFLFPSTGAPIPLSATEALPMMPHGISRRYRGRTICTINEMGHPERPGLRASTEGGHRRGSQPTFSSRYYLKNLMGSRKVCSSRCSVALSAPTHGVGGSISCGHDIVVDRSTRQLCGGMTATLLSQALPCGSLAPFTANAAGDEAFLTTQMDTITGSTATSRPSPPRAGSAEEQAGSPDACSSSTSMPPETRGSRRGRAYPVRSIAWAGGWPETMHPMPSTWRSPASRASFTAISPLTADESRRHAARRLSTAKLRPARPTPARD